MPGPVPKRSDQRRRRNKQEGPELVRIDVSSPARQAPETPGSWHPLVKEWFESLKLSGQAVFYQPSDWVSAKIAGQMLSDALLSGEPVKANLLSEFNKMAADLMTTEGQRRKLRIELTNKDTKSKPGAESDSIMDDYRKMFSS